MNLSRRIELQVIAALTTAQAVNGSLLAGIPIMDRNAVLEVPGECIVVVIPNLSNHEPYAKCLGIKSGQVIIGYQMPVNDLGQNGRTTAGVDAITEEITNILSDWGYMKTFLQPPESGPDTRSPGGIWIDLFEQEAESVGLQFIQQSNLGLNNGVVFYLIGYAI